MDEELERYLWVDERPDVLDAVSLTFVRPASETLIDHLAPRRELSTRLTYPAALDAAFGLDDYAWGSVLVQLGELDGWTAIIEPAGWAASSPDVVARLSAGGVAVNVYWNINADMSASLGRDGSLVREFDPLLYHAGDHPLPEELGLPFGEPRAPIRPACLVFLARVTGATLDEAWLLTRPRRTFVVPVP